MTVLPISSESELQELFNRNNEKVTTCLCENEQDLEVAKQLLEKFDVDFDLYCPSEPYKHDSSIIVKFFNKVKEQRKG